MNKCTSFFVATALLFMGSPAFTQEGVMTGIVTKVDKPQGTVRIQYGQPSATTGTSVDTSEDFQLNDSSLFNTLHAGDKVRFSVEQRNGAKTIMKVEKRAIDD
jgi:Cu/Ag efflux protein CusF